MLRRVCLLPTLAAAAAAPSLMSAARFNAVKGTSDEHDDERWLEALIDEDREKTIEERYAAEKQREVMKAMMKRMRESTKVIEEKHNAQEAEIKALKTKLAELEGKK